MQNQNEFSIISESKVDLITPIQNQYSYASSISINNKEASKITNDYTLIYTKNDKNFQTGN